KVRWRDVSSGTVSVTVEARGRLPLHLAFNAPLPPPPVWYVYLRLLRSTHRHRRFLRLHCCHRGRAGGRDGRGVRARH
ncbi:hypothetical protein BHE74_00052676, partial [Ensete ventricosum]